MLTYHFNNDRTAPFASLGMALYGTTFLFKSAVGFTIDKKIDIGLSLENFGPTASLLSGIYSFDVGCDFATTGAQRRRN